MLMFVNRQRRKYRKYLARDARLWIFALDVPDMGYQPGGEAMASLLPVVTHIQKQILFTNHILREVIMMITLI
jgi:hypothetical protein